MKHSRSRTIRINAGTGHREDGTTTASGAFRKICQQLDAVPAIIEGDSITRYTRRERNAAISKARGQGGHISYFEPE
ncbi:phosphoribulokinase, partial [Morganella morganii]|nr:phosphoribulokinase [Morganella morganii]